MDGIAILLVVVWLGSILGCVWSMYFQEKKGIGDRSGSEALGPVHAGWLVVSTIALIVYIYVH